VFHDGLISYAKSVDILGGYFLVSDRIYLALSLQNTNVLSKEYSTVRGLFCRAMLELSIKEYSLCAVIVMRR
jgi:hypothetical protein